MPFNRVITKFFEGSNIEELMQLMFAYTKTQVEIPLAPESGFADY